MMNSSVLDLPSLKKLLLPTLSKDHPAPEMAVAFFHEAVRSWALNPLPSIAVESGTAMLLNYLRLVSPTLRKLEDEGVPLTEEAAQAMQRAEIELSAQAPIPSVWSKGFGRDWRNDASLATDIAAAVNDFLPRRYVQGTMRLTVCGLHGNVIVMFFHTKEQSCQTK